MTGAELLTLRANAYRGAAKNAAEAEPKLLALAARVVAMLSANFYERFAVVTWLFGDRDTLSVGEATEILRIFPVSTDAEVVASQALFAEILAQTRVPA